jgi:hypothetical protein
MASKKQITSLEILKEYSKGEIVELPPFSDGMNFIARIKRPSMLKLVKSGKIPNELMSTASELFKHGDNALLDPDNGALDKVFEVLENICEASFIEPSMIQLRESGIELTDEQMMFILNYSQQGIKSLTPSL